jgi:hypothetical protein
MTPSCEWQWTVLPKANASETTLFEWPQVKEWAEVEPLPFSYEDKQRMFAQLTEWRSKLEYFNDPKNVPALLSMYVEERRRLSERGGFVIEPEIAIPVGIVLNQRTKKISYISIANKNPIALFRDLLNNPRSTEELRQAFIGYYRLKSSATDAFDSAKSQWMLTHGSQIPSDSIFVRDAGSVHLGRQTPPTDSLAAALPQIKQHFNREHSYDQSWIEMASDLDLDYVDSYLKIDTRARVFEVDIRSSDAKLGKVSWANITEQVGDREGLAAIEREQQEADLKAAGGTWGGDSRYFFTREEARDYVKKAGFTETPVPELIPTTDVIERWFKKVSSGEDAA